MTMQGTVCTPNAKSSHGENMYTNFEVFSFSHSGDILRELKI